MEKEKLGEYQKVQTEGQYQIGADSYLPPFNEIGKRNINRVDGYEKATGKAIYTRDIQFPGMLYAKIFMSPYAHARLIKMDTSKAEALPGVMAIIRYDEPEVKGKILNGSYFGPDHVCPDLSGWALKPQHPILGEEAWYEGQPMAVVVAAVSEEVANQALKLIKMEWKELPFILDPEEALKEGAPNLRPNSNDNLLDDPRNLIEIGDVEKGFEESDKLIEFTGRRGAHLWVGAENPSVIARWLEGKLEMWVQEQQPYHSKMLLSEALGIPMNRITINTVYQGCSFGGRGNPANNSENGMNILAVLLSRKTGRYVKVLYDRKDYFFGESGDMMTSHFKVGFKKNGTIVAVKIKNIFAVYMCAPGIEHFIDNTAIPNLYCKSITVDVSRGPAWWCRCEQLPNSFCLTLVFDHVAAALGMDPTEVALINDGCHGHDMTYLKNYKKEHGFPDIDSLRECIEAGKKSIDWDKKWHKPGTRILPNGKMHGIAFTWDHQWDDVRGTGSAAVMIENDGSVSIIGHHVDIGPNPWTPLCQIVADELGVRFEDVQVKAQTTDQGFSMMSPDGSCNLITNGNIVRKAARKVKRMLLELAAEKFEGLQPENLDVRDGVIFVTTDPNKRISIKEVVAKAMPTHDSCAFSTQAPIIAWSWHHQGLWGQANETGRPRLCRQAHFVEVEVDPETGTVEIIRIVNVNDVGKAISPESVEGQMYGGTYMGVGRALTEEMIWDTQTGVLLNRNLLEYKCPTILDCGEIVPIYLESGMGHGPYGSVGIGEDTATIIPALLGPAVFNAIGKWVDDFPITPSKILKALGKGM